MACDDKVTELRLAHLEADMTDLKQAVKSIDSSLKSLVRLEERHQETRESLDRSFKKIDALDHRIKTLELELPLTRAVRGWGIGAVIGLCGLVLAAMVKGHLV